MDHEWSGWHEDGSDLPEHLNGSLGDADTADLGDSDGGLGGGFDAGHEFAHEDDPFGGGYDQPAEDPAAHAGQEPLPDDTFGDQPDDGTPFDLGHEPAAGPDLGHDPEGPHDAGPHDQGAHDEGPHEDAFGEVEADHVVGTDPDVDSGADDPGWHDTSFPPPLGWDGVPEPVDGFPWSDPDVLGHEFADPAGQIYGGYGAPAVSELLEYAGLDVPTGGDAWAQLLSSDDPATSSLARWWAPGG
jgi:hypothetical protein